MISLIVSKVAVFDPEEWGSELIWSRKDENASGILDDFLNKLHFLHSLDSGLNERGSFGVVSELIDEVLHVFQFHLLAFELPSVSLPILYPQLFKRVVVSLIVLKLLVEKVDRLVTSHIQELPCMRHDNHCIFACAYVIL